jgi:hypothetical protein
LGGGIRVPPPPPGFLVGDVGFRFGRRFRVSRSTIFCLVLLACILVMERFGGRGLDSRGIASIRRFRRCGRSFVLEVLLCVCV